MFGSMYNIFIVYKYWETIIDTENIDIHRAKRIAHKVGQQPATETLWFKLKYRVSHNVAYQQKGSQLKYVVWCIVDALKSTLSSFTV